MFFEQKKCLNSLINGPSVQKKLLVIELFNYFGSVQHFALDRK